MVPSCGAWTMRDQMSRATPVRAGEARVTIFSASAERMGKGARYTPYTCCRKAVRKAMPLMSPSHVAHHMTTRKELERHTSRPQHKHPSRCTQ